MFIIDEITLPKLGNSGLESAFTEEELAIQQSARRLAKEVLEPIAEKLDKMRNEEAIARVIARSAIEAAPSQQSRLRLQVELIRRWKEGKPGLAIL